MKYTVQKLDGRFSYHRYFKYYIGFSHRMSDGHGPLSFTRAHNWSWTNRMDELRIYVKGDAELVFFQLAHQVDQ